MSAKHGSKISIGENHAQRMAAVPFHRLQRRFIFCSCFGLRSKVLHFALQNQLYYVHELAVAQLQFTHMYV